MTGDFFIISIFIIINYNRLYQHCLHYSPGLPVSTFSKDDYLCFHLSSHFVGFNCFLGCPSLPNIFQASGQGAYQSQFFILGCHGRNVQVEDWLRTEIRQDLLGPPNKSETSHHAHFVHQKKQWRISSVFTLQWRQVPTQSQ